MKIPEKAKTFFLSLLVAVFLLFGLSGKAHAAQFTQNGTITGTVKDDLFVSSDHVLIDAIVKGSVFAIGKTVTINGVVEGDAFLVAGKISISTSAIIEGNLILLGATMDISGDIGGSLFAGGQLVNLHDGAFIGRNFYFAGYNLSTEENSSISKDAYFGGSQAILRGNVSNDFHAAASGIELYGEITRNAKLRVGSPGDGKQLSKLFALFLPNSPNAIDAGLRVYPGAVVGGELSYTSTTNQSASIQSPLASAVLYQTPVPSETQKINTDLNAHTVSSTSALLAWIWTFLRRLITMLVLGALYLWLMPRFASGVRQQMINRPAFSFGYGLLVAIVGFFAILVIPILFTLVGLFINFLSLGGLTFTWYGVIGALLLFLFVAFLWLVFIGGTLEAAYSLGYFIINKLAPKARGIEFLGMLFGVTVYIILLSTPWYINWIFALAAGATGLGATWLAYRRSRRERKLG
jgi:cytoskeletal protein CcmA (bactofilin family)